MKFLFSNSNPSASENLIFQHKGDVPEKYKITVIPSDKELLDLDEVFKDITDRMEINKEENEYWDKKINDEFKKHKKRYRFSYGQKQHFAEQLTRKLMNDPDMQLKNVIGDDHLLYEKIMQKIEHAIKDKDVIGASGKPVQRLRYPKTVLSMDEWEMIANVYLNYLAKELDTPEKVGKFLNLYMSYTPDSPVTHIPTKHGTRDNHGEYWQTPQETVWRMAYGEMLGDCDDYALLAKEIVSRWDPPKNVHVLQIPKHAICLWTEKNDYGNWDAYSLGTYGLDKNGNRKSFNRFGEQIKYSNDPRRDNGYSRIDQAINSVLAKYDKPGLGVDEPVKYRVEKGGDIKIMYVPEKGRRYVSTFSLELFEKKFDESLKENLSDDGADYLENHPYYKYRKNTAFKIGHLKEMKVKPRKK